MDFFLTHYPQFVFMAILLLSSAFFSGSETSFFSLSRVELHKFCSFKGTLAHIITKLNRESAEFLGTVLFCNMLVNILFYSLASLISFEVAKKFGSGVAVLFSLASLLVVIICGEVVPKSLAVLAPTLFFKFSAMPMFFLHRLVSPLRVFLRRITLIIEKLADPGQRRNNNQLEELKLMLQAVANEGGVSKHESNLVSEVLDFSQVKVKEFMTPRVDLVMAEDESTSQQLLNLALETGHSKIPLYHADWDQITGVIDVRNLLLNASENTTDYIKTPLIISAYQKSDRALKQMKNQKQRLAVVVDEYGGTAGIVTLTDIIDEIFAQRTEGADFEDEMPEIQSLGSNRFLLSGSLSLRDWRGFLGFSEKLPAVNTVAGLVICLLGHIPKKGDKIRLGRLFMQVTSIERKRIRQVQLTILPEVNRSEDTERFAQC